MHLDGGTWKTYFGYKNEPGPGSDVSETEANPLDPRGTGGYDHMVNFFNAIRSGKRSELSCDIEEGYMSSALPLLANAAYRMGQTLEFDGKSETFKGNRKANQLLKRTGRKPYVIPS